VHDKSANPQQSILNKCKTLALKYWFMEL